jgi:hypothetical protein
MTATHPTGIAALIYLEFLKAIQDAEELHGPELPEYIELMEKISQEAINRKNTALNIAWESGIIPRNKYDTRFDKPT